MPPFSPARRALLAALAGQALRLRAAQARDPAPAIFNGRDLSGWSIQEGPESAFHVVDGAIAGSRSAEYPAWLRYDREYENFDFTCEFFFSGWNDGGVYLHAPEHGPPSACGLKINIFHHADPRPLTNSMGAVFPLVAPLRADLHHENKWNRLRIRLDWPELKVWVNDGMVQDLKLDSLRELSRRLRHGYLGFVTLRYPLRFRDVRVRELPGKHTWTPLYEQPGDLSKWYVSDSSEKSPARFEPLGQVLSAGGLGHLATREQFRDFELELYVRGERRHNGGVIVRSAGRGTGRERHYEIQLHDVAEAHFPTGSLYHHKRSIYPRIEDEKWFLMQLGVKDRSCWVRIDGDTVLEYDDLENLEPGSIELQAHDADRWLEFKRIRVRRI